MKKSSSSSSSSSAAAAATAAVSEDKVDECRLCGTVGNQLLLVPGSCGYKAKHYVHEACVVQRTEYLVRESKARYPRVSAKCSECGDEFKVLLKRAKDSAWNRDRFKIEKEYPAAVHFLTGFANYSGLATRFPGEIRQNCQTAFESVRPALGRFQQLNWENEPITLVELRQIKKPFRFIVAPDQAESSPIKLKKTVSLELDIDGVTKLFGGKNASLKVVENIFRPHFPEAYVRLLFRRVCGCREEEEHDELFWKSVSRNAIKRVSGTVHRVSVLIEASIGEKEDEENVGTSKCLTQAVAWQANATSRSPLPPPLLPPACPGNKLSSSRSIAGDRAQRADESIRKFAGVSALLFETNFTALRRGINIDFIVAVPGPEPGPLRPKRAE